MAFRLPGADNPEDLWSHLVEARDLTKTINRTSNSTTSTQHGGFLEEIFDFDADFFGLSAKLLEEMDPQHRLFLETGYEALETANISADSILGTPTGVFVGISAYDAVLMRARAFPDNRVSAYTNTGGAFSTASGRVSHLFGLEGPSFACDAACSSSLLAVHLACQSLRAGECQLALAGGVNVMLFPDTTRGFEKLGVVSSDGRCRPFSASASGYGRGEGCGVVVLKPLSSAKADGDVLWGIIRGTAINHVGRSGSLTAPRGPSQSEVVRCALSEAGIQPEDVGYVEAHGTGTPLGDLIEVQALASAYAGKRTAPIAIGSIKANIGHLEAAAGIAGLIKVLLSFKHEAIPPQPHLECLNPGIDLGEIPVLFPSAFAQWPASSPRFAGVHTYGISGVNAHAIIEAPPRKETVSECGAPEYERPLHLLCISAKTSEALSALAERYQNQLASHSDAVLPDVCFTANVGRTHFGHRLAVMGATTEQIRGRLEEFLQRGAAVGVITGQLDKPATTGFVFSDGRTTSGAGRELYDTQPTFRTALDRCAEILKNVFDQPLSSLVFARDTSPQDRKMRDVCVFSLQYATAEMWRSWGINPTLALGFGQAEIAAACCAGLLVPNEGIHILLGEMERQPAKAPNQPGARFPFLSGATGERITTNEAALAHLQRSRRPNSRSRAEAISMARNSGCDLLLEIGAVPARGTPTTELDQTLPSLGPQDSDWTTTLTALATLYTSGAAVDWRRFDRDYQRRKVQVPTYPFQRRRIPLLGMGSAPADAEGDRYFKPIWKRLAQEPERQSGPHDGTWLIFSDVGGTGAALAKKLGQDQITITHGQQFERSEQGAFQLSPDAPDQLEHLVRSVQGTPLAGVIYLWNLDLDTPPASLDALEETLKIGNGGLLFLLQALIKGRPGQLPKIWVVTRGAHTVAGETTPVNVVQAPVWSLAQTALLEHGDLRCVCVDLDPANDSPDPLLNLLHAQTDECEIALRTGGWYVRRMVPHPPMKVEGAIDVRSDGAYLVTGGLGALGLHTARWLVEGQAGAVILTGRRAASRAANEALQKLRGASTKVIEMQADVTSQADIKRVLSEISKTGYGLRGVFHSAGLVSDRVLLEQTWGTFFEVMAPKVAGAWNLHLATRGDDLDHFVLYSSVAAMLGSPGQSNYAAANAFLDSLAHHRRAIGLPAKSINWGPWAESGMAADAAQSSVVKQRWKNLGLTVFSPDEGVEALGEILAADVIQVCYLPLDRSQLIRSLGKKPLLAELREDQSSPVEPTIKQRGLELERQILDVYPDADRIREIVANVVGEVVSELMGVDLADLDFNRGVQDLGADSVTLIELRSILGEALGRPLPSDFMFRHPTVQSMADALAEEIAAEVKRQIWSVARRTYGWLVWPLALIAIGAMSVVAYFLLLAP
jgi:acyl transferase domain-containing protein/acyl carrier protein